MYIFTKLQAVRSEYHQANALENVKKKTPIWMPRVKRINLNKGCHCCYMYRPGR